MLSQTIDEIMSRAKKFEHLTRATKFSSAFKNNTFECDDEHLMQKRISRYTKKEQPVEIEQDWNIEDLIVEDPEEMKIDIEFKHTEGNRKPFFRSIGAKLSNRIQYQA